MSIINVDMAIGKYCLCTIALMLSGFFNEQGRWNVRFSWEYKPPSFIYLVFNDAQTDAFVPVQQSTQFIRKITFL